MVAVPCALTGYVSQQNFDAQWISTQAKDAMNAAGIGAFWNLRNFGQMYCYHVLLLPAAVIALVLAHILLVRKHGIVPPFPLSERGAEPVPKAGPCPSPCQRCPHEPREPPGLGVGNMGGVGIGEMGGNAGGTGSHAIVIADRIPVDEVELRRGEIYIIWGSPR